MTSISTFFRLTPSIEASKQAAIEEIDKGRALLGVAAVNGNFVSTITDVLYSAHSVDGRRMIKEIFFPGCAAIKKVKERRALIDEELQMITSSSFGDTSRQLRLMNLYRAVVADLFDPYLSMIVASLQLIEGAFTSFLVANLGQGERNKYEYAQARLPTSSLFDGYNPIVRNALSHTGSDSVLHHEGKIVFKGIKRGNPPQVEIVKWDDEELLNHLLVLMDFVYAIEISINIFGLDVSEQIQSTPSLRDIFFSDVIDTKDRLYIQQGFDELIDRIRQETQPKDGIQQALSTIFFLECTKRSMPVNGIRFAKSERAMVIDVPAEGYDSTDDGQIMNRLKQLIRYGVIAEPCFRQDFDWFVVSEPKDTGTGWIQVKLKRQDLFDYGQETAGLVDLLHGCTSVLNGKPITVEIDFAKQAEAEILSFETIFPRRPRP